MAQGDLDRDPRRHRGSLPGLERHRLERIEVESRIAVVGAGRQGCARIEPPDRQAHTGPAARRELREARGDARRQADADAHALGRVLAFEVAGELVQLGEPSALAGRAATTRRSGAAPRTRRWIRSISFSMPSPVCAEISTASWCRCSSSARRSASTRSAFASTSTRGASRCADLREYILDRRRDTRPTRPPAPRRRRRAGSRPRSRVSSSVAPNASTSWWGSLRMNPTVSVTR